jgi:hypothetical protein
MPPITPIEIVYECAREIPGAEHAARRARDRRDRHIVKAFEAGNPLEGIAQAAMLSESVVRGVLRAHGIIIPRKPREPRRGGRGAEVVAQ